MSRCRFLTTQGGIAQIGLDFLQTASFHLGSQRVREHERHRHYCRERPEGESGPHVEHYGEELRNGEVTDPEDDRTDPTAVPRTLRERSLRQSARTPILR